MKELNNEKIYLDRFDINVTPYLTYAKIQQIANATITLSSPDENGIVHNSWAERQKNIDMLLLYHATDIGAEVLEKTEHDILIESGLIDEIYKTVKNTNQIYNAIAYEESFMKAYSKVSDKLADMLKKMEIVAKK